VTLGLKHETIIKKRRRRKEKKNTSQGKMERGRGEGCVYQGSRVDGMRTAYWQGLLQRGEKGI
jgi:hypothetical protein